MNWEMAERGAPERGDRERGKKADG